MTYNARWITHGSYIIGDAEYGFELCRLNLYDNLIDLLTLDEVGGLVQKVTDAVNYAIMQAAKREEEADKMVGG